jgi:hypothetical protein
LHASRHRAEDEGGWVSTCASDYLI